MDGKDIDGLEYKYYSCMNKLYSWSNNRFIKIQKTFEGRKWIIIILYRKIWGILLLSIVLINAYIIFFIIIIKLLCENLILSIYSG